VLGIDPRDWDSDWEKNNTSHPFPKAYNMHIKNILLFSHLRHIPTSLM
jgi:hypothetical protein